MSQKGTLNLQKGKHIMKNTKTIIATAVLTVLSTSAFAVGSPSDVAANASSAVSAYTSTNASSAGNGYAEQSAEAGAFNASYAGAHNLGTETSGYLNFGKTSWSKSYEEVSEGAAYTGTEGGSYTSVSGFSLGNADSSSFAKAKQEGDADASVRLSNTFGTLGIKSGSDVDSSSFSKNDDFGYTKNYTNVEANNLTTGTVGGSIYKAGKSVWGFPITTTSIVNTSIADVHTTGSTSSYSKDKDFWAYGKTGGSASQFGGGKAVAP
jgi:hypothetical protein